MYCFIIHDKHHKISIKIPLLNNNQIIVDMYLCRLQALNSNFSGTAILGSGFLPKIGHQGNCQGHQSQYQTVFQEHKARYSS